MSTNELPVEKRIAANLSIPESPPVFPEAALNDPGPVEVLGEPPHVRLLLERIEPNEITADFLVGIHDLADDHGLGVEGVSVGQCGYGE